LTLYLVSRTVVAVPEPTFLILTALSAQPLHGYGIVQSVRLLSDGAVKLRPGLLFGALDRLDQRGLIAVDREDEVDGHVRRYYRLSDRGAAVLAAQPRPRAVVALRPSLAGGAA
jgi:DNA-binding PadR family transcriptional regulator